MTIIVSVLLFRTVSTIGIRHRFSPRSLHPLSTASLDTVIMVLCASYTFTLSLSNIVMYPASAYFAVLSNEFSLIPGVMCSSLAGRRTSNGYSAISFAGMTSPFGSMNSLVDGLPVRLLGSSSVPMLDVAPLSATVDAMVPFLIASRISSSFMPITCIVVAVRVFSPVLLHCSFSLRFRTIRSQRALILFLVAAGVDGEISIVVLNFTCFVCCSCSSTWLGGGDKHA